MLLTVWEFCGTTLHMLGPVVAYARIWVSVLNVRPKAVFSNSMYDVPCMPQCVVASLSNLSNLIPDFRQIDTRYWTEVCRFGSPVFIGSAKWQRAQRPDRCLHNGHFGVNITNTPTQTHTHTHTHIHTPTHTHKHIVTRRRRMSAASMLFLVAVHAASTQTTAVNLQTSR